MGKFLLLLAIGMAVLYASQTFLNLIRGFVSLNIRLGRVLLAVACLVFVIEEPEKCLRLCAKFANFLLELIF